MKPQVQPAREITHAMRADALGWRRQEIDRTQRYCCQVEADFFASIRRFARELLAPFRFMLRCLLNTRYQR